ncbi:hypothetical protein SESBI_21178 [Sesbania bispinosa]|nr:hypothetical protein SESBI_21178 [Sesbania bispinosa]
MAEMKNSDLANAAWQRQRVMAEQKRLCRRQSAVREAGRSVTRKMLVNSRTMLLETTGKCHH